LCGGDGFRQSGGPHQFRLRRHDGEPFVDQLGGLGIPDLAVLAAHDHGNHPHTAPLGGHRNRKTSRLVVSGLESVTAGKLTEQFVVVMHHEFVFPESFAPGTGVLQGFGLFGQGTAENGKVTGCGHIGFLPFGGRQAMHRMKFRIFHAQFLRLLVHQDNKPVLGPSNMRRQGNGGIVGGLHHQGIQQILHRKLLLGVEIHLGATGLGRFRRHLHHLVQFQGSLPDTLQDHVEIHQFEHAGRVQFGVGIGLKQNLAAVSLDQQGGCVGVLGKAFHRCPRGPDNGNHHQHEQDTECTTFHLLHDSRFIH